MIQLVVQDKKIPNTEIFHCHFVVELPSVASGKRSIGKVLDQLHYGNLNQVDTGRLQRLEKTTGQSDGNAVFLPALLAPARGNTYKVLLSQCVTLYIFL